MRVRRLLHFLLYAGLAASLISAVRPVAPPAVEIALDYASARRFAMQQGYPVDRLLAAFRQAGTTTLLVGDTTLYDLANQGQIGYPADYPVRVAVLAGHEARAHAQVDRSLSADDYRLTDTYIFIRDNPALADWLEDALMARFGRERITRLPQNPPGSLIVLTLTTERSLDLLLTPLGVLPPDIETARRHGYGVAVALSQRPYPQEVNPRTTLLIRALDPAAVVRTFPSHPVTVLLRGQEVPGYPDRITALSAALAERGDTLALHRERAPGHQPFPLGIETVVAAAGPRQVKAYVMSYKDRAADWVSAAKERGIRFFVVEAFLLSENGEKDVVTVTGWIRDLGDRLRQVGLSLGRAQARPFDQPASVPAALMGLAVAAALVELGRRFVTSPGRRGPIAPWWLRALAVATLLVGPTLAVAAPVAGRQVLALLAAVSFPVLGVLSVAASVSNTGAETDPPGSRDAANPSDLGADLRRGVDCALRVAFWSAAGGLLLHALLLSPRFLLELDLFRGVKLNLVAPTLLVLTYWVWQERAVLRAALLRLGHREVQFGALIAGALVFGAAGLMIARSTYAGAPVLGVEVHLREALDRWLWVRPRFKEILIGYPALFLAAFWLRRRFHAFGLVALAAGVVAGASVTNSFAHIHIPLSLTALRTLHGLWIGILVGGLLIVGVGLWQSVRRDWNDG